MKQRNGKSMDKVLSDLMTYGIPTEVCKKTVEIMEHMKDKNPRRAKSRIEKNFYSTWKAYNILGITIDPLILANKFGMSEKGMNKAFHSYGCMVQNAMFEMGIAPKTEKDYILEAGKYILHYCALAKINENVTEKLYALYFEIIKAEKWGINVRLLALVLINEWSKKNEIMELKELSVCTKSVLTQVQRKVKKYLKNIKSINLM